MSKNTGYKNSPLGLIPEDWQLSYIKNCSLLITKGATPTTYGFDFVDSGINFIRGVNIRDDGSFDDKDIKYISRNADIFLSRSRLEENDIVISIVGTLGLSLVIKPSILPANINQNTAIIRFELSKLNIRFVFHFIHSFLLLKQIRLESTIQAQPSLSLKQVGKFKIIVPSFSEQKNIAEILDTLDDVIAKTEAAIAKLKNIKTGLVHDLLTRGLDENGELRDPIKYPEQFKESALGLIPKDWEVKELSQIADVDRGKFTHRPRNDPNFYGGKYPFIQTGDITKNLGKVINSYSQTLNKNGIKVSREFPVGTIAVTIAANIADTAILGIPMFFPDSVVGVVVFPEFDNRLVELYIRKYKHKLDAEATQSAQKNINLENLRPLLIPYPKSLKEQKKISLVYSQIDKKINYEEAYLEKLQLQKKGLMHDLLTGKKRVNHLL